MAFVASHYLAPIAAIQQRIRTKKATQLDSENFYIRSSIRSSIRFVAGEDGAEGAGGPVRAPFRPLEKRL